MIFIQRITLLLLHLQAGAIALIQCLLQHQGSAHLGVFMAAKVSNVANLHSGALIRRRLAEHPHFLPVWLGTMDGLALNLPSADQLQTHAHLSAGHRHLLTLLHGLGGVPADDDDDAGILLSGRCCHLSRILRIFAEASEAHRGHICCIRRGHSHTATDG